jgi:hypothetical protein
MRVALSKRLTIGVIAAALAATVSFVAAGPYRRAPLVAAALSPDDLVNSVQTLGLVPTTRVFRRGPFYVLHALDRYGTELRIVADAGLGDILSVTPIYVPRVDAGPRIIHVPQPRHGAGGQPHRAKRRPPPAHD